MDLRFRFLLISFVGLLAVGVWTFPFWRPFLIDESVNEYFPGLDLEKQEEFLSMPEDEREALLEMREENPEMALQMVEAMLQEETQAPESEFNMEVEDTVSVLRTGQFGEIDPLHWAEGAVNVYQFSDTSRTLRFEEFVSAPGVELHVVFSRQPDPAVNGVGVDYIDLGRLKGTRGNQNYSIPESVDLSRYISVVIYCVPLNAVVSVATLQ